MSLVFARQVAVIDSVTGKVLEYISRNDAMCQHAAGSVKIDFIRPGAGVVCVARLADYCTRRINRRTIDAKPGSFGIDREEFSGSVVFAHKQTWDWQLAEMAKQASARAA